MTRLLRSTYGSLTILAILILAATGIGYAQSGGGHSSQPSTGGHKYGDARAVRRTASGPLGSGSVTYADPSGNLKTDTTLAFNDTTETLTIGDPATATRVVIDDGGTIWTGANASLTLGVNGTSIVQITTGLALSPVSDNARDLGSTSLSWKDIYLDGKAMLGAIADPSAPGASTGAIYAKSLTSATYLAARFPTGNVQVIAGEPFSVNTTDATVTTCLTVPVPTNSVLYFEVRATGYQSAGTNAAGYMVAATYKNVSGTVTQIGASSTFTHESNAAWDFAPSISGTNVLLRVTGAAATTIDWDCTIAAMNVSP